MYIVFECLACDFVWFRVICEFCGSFAKFWVRSGPVWSLFEAGLRLVYLGSDVWKFDMLWYRAGGPVSKYIKFSKPVSSHGFDFPVRLFWVFVQSGPVIFEALPGLVLSGFRVGLSFAASSLGFDFVSIQLCWALSCLAYDRRQVMP